MSQRRRSQPRSMMERSPSSLSISGRPSSKIEVVPELVENTHSIHDHEELGIAPDASEEEDNGEDEEDNYIDPKSRYFSWLNILCIILSLIISAFFIFEPQLISAFWKVYAPEETAEYMVNLRSCKMPNLYDGESELPFMWDLDVSRSHDLANVDFKCEGVSRFSTVLDNNRLVLLTKLKKKRCCLRDITRPWVMNADMYKVSNQCNEVENITDLSDKEFVLVQCSHSRNKSVDFNTHALLPAKPSVKAKLAYWNKALKKKAERPYSVAVIIISSTSRAHAYRSLPDTMSFLEGKSKFTVMNGYNSMEDNGTILSSPNIVPLITGTLASELDDMTYWDNGTKLMLDFENSKFVSLFMDESRKLLRSNRVDPYGHRRFKSFKKQPADYYMKAFLEAHAEATEALFLNRITAKEHCFGKRTITQYLLHHLLKFHHKFSMVPCFSFSYLTWPQVPIGLESLAKMDKTYLDFFKEFLRAPQMLQKTFIVVMSDMGQLNHSYYNTEHGHLEKRNPLLMLRLPDNLVRNHPEFSENLKLNSHRLVSAIDVHQTISIFSKLGVMQEPELESTQDTTQDTTPVNMKNEDEKEKRVITGRNLFVSEIPHDRNCSQAYIPDKLCLCGASLPDKFNGRTITINGHPEKYWRYHVTNY